jgi:hypothetical protein
MLTTTNFALQVTEATDAISSIPGHLATNFNYLDAHTMTLDTTQTITATKTFTTTLVASGGLNLAAGKKLDLDPSGTAGYMMAETVAGTTFTDSLAGDTVFRESNTGRQHFGTATGAGAAQASMLMVSDTGVGLGRGAKSFGSGTGVLNLTDATTDPTTNPTSGIIIYSSGGRGKLRDNLGNTWNLDGSVLVRAAANITTSVTTNAAALTTPTLAPGTYMFEVNGAWSSSATTTGMKFAMQTSGTSNAMLLNGLVSTGASNASFAGVAISLGTQVGPTTAAVASTLYPVQITGTIVLTAAGNLSLQIASSSAVLTTFAGGSYMKVTRIA